MIDPDIINRLVAHWVAFREFYNTERQTVIPTHLVEDCAGYSATEMIEKYLDSHPDEAKEFFTLLFFYFTALNGGEGLIAIDKTT